MKILITGGHSTPAMAVIDELKKHASVEIVFVGRKVNQPGDNSQSFEYQSVIKRKIKFINLLAGKLSRLWALKTLVDFLRLPAGLINSVKIIQNEKPDLVLTFGGYIAFSISLAAFLSGTAFYTHEQTLIPGITNRIISVLAKKIMISYPQTQKYFNRKKTILTGNPLRECILRAEKPEFKVPSDRPIIYITGGSLGSHSINIHIEKILHQLVAKYTIIHQTGDSAEFGDFERLSKKSGDHYIVKKHILEEEIGYIYSICDLVISRSGANTIAELITLKKPAILIPLPWSGSGEQWANASLMAESGAAEIFDQGRESDMLYDLIIKLDKNLDTYSKNFDKLKDYDFKDAAKRVVAEILSQS